jgi:type IV pilus assembly protein PilV
MVSVGLFLVGVLSLVQLNATLVRQTSEAKYRADASFLAQEISGQMWADRVNVNSYGTSSYAPRVAFTQKVQLALPNGGVNIATTSSASKTDAVITVS